MELRPVFVEVLPKQDMIGEGELWISHKHRTMNLRCPCGCGHLTMLTIHPSRWHIRFDGYGVSLDGPTGGSVWTTAQCNSHYCIRDNRVVWLAGIDPLRRGEYVESERRRMVSTTLDDRPDRPKHTRGRRLWQHVRRCWGLLWR